MWVIKELRKIEEILGWHPEFEVDKIIRKIKARTRFTVILMSLLMILGTSFVFTYIKKQDTIKSLQSNIDILENTIWVNNDIKDSLMNTLEASGYLRYLIETESGIKIPKNLNNDDLKYMFERSIDQKIPVAIMFRLIYKESRFDSTAVSSKNAKGYMQIIPSTYNSYCEKLNIEPKPFTNQKNIYVGTYLLKENYNFWKEKKPGSSEKVLWKYALATYNTGNVNDSTFQNSAVNHYVSFILQSF